MLRVTRLTDYATVVLTVLAVRPGDVHSAAELAEATGIEPTTVSKVLKPLAQAGLVDGFRGASGGYRLARTAAEISLIQIVEAIEGRLALTECADHGGGHCGISARCTVRDSWRRINDVLGDTLRSVTLADMLDPPPPRRRDIPLRVATA